MSTTRADFEHAVARWRGVRFGVVEECRLRLKGRAPLVMATLRQDCALKDIGAVASAMGEALGRSGEDAHMSVIQSRGRASFTVYLTRDLDEHDGPGGNGAPMTVFA